MKHLIAKEVLPMWYAHSLPDAAQSAWQTLDEHLDNTTRLAGDFASVFGAQDFAALAAGLHDAGKYTGAFQRRLAGDPHSVIHSTEGGRIAIEQYGKVYGQILAYAILGHHGHLPNAGSAGQPGSLAYRLKEHPQPTSAFLQQRTLPARPAPPQFDRAHAGFQCAMFIRMLFSCLVDADCLDTEQFMLPEHAALRRDSTPAAERDELLRCKQALDKKLAEITADADPTNVNIQRAYVLNACRNAAQMPPGIFSLTVPTGGGKTYSLMTFALDHALLHDQRRVIYVAPFTSIIDQNAEVYRDVFGPEAVLEHHSAVGDHAGNNADKDKEKLHLQLSLATENWASPIVITTAVQFFESLFASRKWRCRKLHNITGSVIVLDEAQTLPDALLLPTLAALETLCAQYGCTVLLCTATQPALGQWWPSGTVPREIVPNPDALYENLRRTRVHKLGTLDVAQVAERLRAHPQALCIVSTRARARALYTALSGQPGLYHLSARMCPMHRSEVVTEIKTQLKSGNPCLVISTQLIEAGVDVDFPVVYREVGGIDAIAQAAGRCNREGLQPEGQVYVYQPAEGLPKGWIATCASAAEPVLATFDDPLSLEAVHAYSSRRFALRGKEALDERDILRDLNSDDTVRNLSIEFRDIARRYRLIDDTGETVYVPHGEEGKRLIEALYTSENPGTLARSLQRYGVNLYPQEYAKMLAAGWIQVQRDLYPVLVLPKYYDEHTGLKPFNDLMETGSYIS